MKWINRMLLLLMFCVFFLSVQGQRIRHLLDSSDQYYYKMQFGTALTITRIAAAEAIRDSGRNSRIYAEILGLYYAMNLEAMGRFDTAITCYKAGIALYRKLQVADTVYATVLLNLGNLYNAIKLQPDSATDYFDEAAPIILNKMSKYNIDYAATLNNLGLFYYNQGDYRQAEKFYYRSFDNMDTYHRVSTDTLLFITTNLVELYKATGAFRKAFLVLDRCLSRLDPEKTKNPTGVLRALVQYGELHYIVRPLKSIHDSIIGVMTKLRPVIRDTLLLSEFIRTIKIGKYVLRCQPDSAIRLYETSNRTVENRALKNELSHSVASLITDAYIQAKQYDKALLLHKADSAQISTISDKRGLLRWQHLQKGVDVYLMSGQHARAKSLLLAMDSLSNTLNARFSSMPDHLQWEMYHGFRNALSKTMQYMDKTGDCDPVLIGLLFNNQLRYRNSIMNRKVLVNKYVRETGKTEAYALLRRIDRVQNRIAHFYITTSNASLASQHEQEVITLNERLEALVPSLQQIGAEAHTWQMLRDKLQPGEVLIDFVLYSRLDDAYKLNPTKTYAALVLRKTDTIPGYEVLCRGRELADLNAAVNPKPGKVNVKDLIAERVRYRGRDIRPLTELYQLIWAKLEPHFKGQQKLYYIPNGEFALLPLEALGKVKGQYLRAEIKMEMLQSYLSFITPPANPALNQQIELWGDMPYGKGFDPLGAKELMNITEILTGSRFAIQQHDKSRATEQRFKQTPHTASIIHLSTHGFYAADVYLTNFTQLNYQAISPFAYLFYSGLAFANANIAAMPTQYDADWPGSNKDDGILYSYEIKDMDLHATDLVVLSACETGQGVSSFNEGVLGLQQAFKLAGVNRVLMSLWEVNRGFTENWMRRFYGWLKKLSGNVEAAFHATQSEMIKDGQSPYAWAGFVLVK